jgi:hypothetical protein
VVAAPALDPLAETAPAALPPARLARSGHIAPPSIEPFTPWIVRRGLPAAERGFVRRVQVSAAEARAFGIYAGSREFVNAEIVVGEDGVARAIRFLR